MMQEVELEQAIQHCTIGDIGMEITGEDAQPVIDAINDYLQVFAQPQTRDEGNSLLGYNKCLNCGTVLDGAMGSFTWGIQHGEGICRDCGWPCRAYHVPKDESGEQIFNRRLEIVLQYHPDNVSTTRGKEQ